jgi:hypothetical protein
MFEHLDRVRLVRRCIDVNGDTYYVNRGRQHPILSKHIIHPAKHWCSEYTSELSQLQQAMLNKTNRMLPIAFR